jgi:hypothetical protein
MLSRLITILNGRLSVVPGVKIGTIPSDSKVEGIALGGSPYTVSELVVRNLATH